MPDDTSPIAPADHEYMIALREYQIRYLRCLEHSLWHVTIWESGLSYSFYCFECGHGWTYLAGPQIVFPTVLVKGADDD